MQIRKFQYGEYLEPFGKEGHFYSYAAYHNTYPLIESLSMYKITNSSDLEDVVSSLLDGRLCHVPLKTSVPDEYKGLSDPRTDDRFLSILQIAQEINPNLDVNQLFQLYYAHRHFIPSVNGDHEFASIMLIFTRRIATDDDDDIGVFKRRIDHGGILNTLESVFHISQGYIIQESDKYRTIETTQHAVGTYTETLFIPKQYAAFVALYLKDNNLMRIVSTHSQYIRNMVIAGVKQLGKSGDTLGIGNKASGFLVFEKLGFRYPHGIVLSEQLVRTILQSTGEDKAEYIRLINEQLKNIGIDIAKVSFSVRSNPKKSMPGILKTVTDTRELLPAIQEVAQAWDTEQARAFRRRAKMDDAYDLPIIIQLWVSGYKEVGYEAKRAEDPSLPLYAAGAFSTRDPNTNKQSLFGKYRENAKGEELMTGGRTGEDINKLAQTAPEIYHQLLAAGETLEKEVGPQEVEFVVNNGRLYFTQTRKISFAPQAEIAYINKRLAEGKITQAQAIPQIEALQSKLGSRLLYKVKAGIGPKVLAQGVATTPGAMQGYLAWDMDKVRQLMSEQKPVIFVSYKGNQNQVLDLIFTNPRSGLITSYGDSTAHEVDLTRDAGIPSLINLDAAEWRLTGENQGIVLKDGRVIKEGESVVIDGDRNALFIADDDVLEENEVMKDASYGIDVPDYRKAFLAPYLNADESIKPEFTVQRLEELNQAATDKFHQAQAGTDKQAAFTANIEKHFFHELLTRVQISKSQGEGDKSMNGGIDLNQIGIKRTGKIINIQFDPAQLSELMQGGFEGFTPVITSITNIASPFQLLGIGPVKEGESVVRV